jgi:hypothetical protein
MTRRIAIALIILVLGIGGLLWYRADSFVRPAPLDVSTPDAKQMTAEEKLAAAAAQQMAQTLTGLRESIKKANPNQKTKIRPAPRPDK